MRKIAVFFGTFFISILFLTNFAVASSFSYNVCSNKNASLSAVCSSNPPGSSTTSKSNADPISVKIASIIKIIVEVAGIIAVVVIIISGIRYALSTGDANKVNSAKNNLIYALIGLAVIVLADTIVSYVISQLKG